MTTGREDTTVLLQRYFHAHELYVSYLNRFFDVSSGRAPTRTGDTLTDEALDELLRLHSEEQAAHELWFEGLRATRRNA